MFFKRPYNSGRFPHEHSTIPKIVSSARLRCRYQIRFLNETLYMEQALQSNLGNFSPNSMYPYPVSGLAGTIPKVIR